MSFQFFHQYDTMDCGPACLQMIFHYYGHEISIQNIRQKAFLNKEGVSLLSLNNVAVSYGFNSYAAQLNINQLTEVFKSPCILHWKGEHFVVLVKIGKRTITIADPAHGVLELPIDALNKFWLTSGGEGVALFVTVNSDQRAEILSISDPQGKRFNPMRKLLQYLEPYKLLLNQLWLGLLVACLFDLLLPFTTQSMIDYGVNFKQISFINLLLIAQLGIFFSRSFIDWVRSKILLYVGAEVNLSIVSSFLNKLMHLPISFFDGKHVGDITQRINDQKRLEQFLTANTLSTFFSLFNLLVYSIILIYFSIAIFLIFTIGSIASIGWILYFQKERKSLDYLTFQKLSKNQSQLFELVTSMPDIKLSGASSYKTNQWRQSQTELYSIKSKLLNLNRMQQFGAAFFNQLKNILITYIAAMEVIEGENGMTLGALIAISFIVGQMNSPIEKLLDFIRSWQDAKLSLLRLNEVEEMKEEDATINSNFEFKNSIQIENLSFSYTGDKRFCSLENINLQIPFGKTTAIVGSSGSGKTSLIKLLLKFYEPLEGRITVDSSNLTDISALHWRDKIGVVLQEGMLFSDTIAANIIATGESVDEKRLNEVILHSNLKAFVDGLPNGLNTQIGQSGEGVSVGQKQRILLARALYKNPKILILDEATSALDAVNEREIVEHLSYLGNSITKIIVAHRLSTVKNADQIIVLDKGSIVEIGNHEQLIALKGPYYNLVKNQLEVEV